MECFFLSLSSLNPSVLEEVTKLGRPQTFVFPGRLKM